jgi:hypothetical protein
MALPSTCPDCGQRIRPCNMMRHRRARHIPKETRTVYGSKFSVPKQPIRLGKEKDRRYDDLVPRGVGKHQYRIYRLRAGELQLLATARTPEQFGVGIARLHDKGEFVGDDSVGVLNTATDPGSWVINPWTLGRRPIDE